MNGNYDIYFARLLEETRKEHFPEVRNSDVVIDLKVKPVVIDEEISVERTGIEKWKNGPRYVIRGSLPGWTVREFAGEAIIRGVIGHELAHIARGDCDKILLSLRNLCFELPCIGRMLYRRNERRTDAFATRRGLGYEIRRFRDKNPI
jgi:hypothetical protein